MLSCCSILTLPEYCKAQNQKVPNDITQIEEELDEVIVSALRSPDVQSQLMRVVQIISSKEIEQSCSQNISGILEYARGVDIRHRGGYGMQADVSIRGGTFDQTLILLNGINISDSQSGHHNLNIPVDVESIDRIEVLQGAGARIYGPNAFNGAINIITKTPEQAYLNTSLSLGQHSYKEAAVSGSFSTGIINHYLAANAGASDGFTDNTDFQNGNIFYNSEINLKSFDVAAQTGYNLKAFGANSFYTPKFPNQFEETQTTFASVKIIPHGKIKIIPTIYWRQHHDRFELFRNNAPEWYLNHNYHLSNSAGANIKWSHVHSYSKSSISLDYRFEDIYSNVLGHDLKNPKPISYDNDIFYTKYYQRTGLSIMAEESFYINDIIFSGGLLTYYNTDLKNGLDFFPGIDLGWQFYNNWRIIASANRTLRMPTFTDLFYNSPTHMANSDLQPEKAYSLESGIKNQSKAIHFELIAFKRWGVNMIDWVMFENDDKWQSLNHTNIDISGIELYFRKHINFIKSNSHTKPNISFAYTYMYADKESGQMISQYALDFLKSKLDIQISLPVFKNGGVNLDISRQHRAGGYMQYDNGYFTNTINFEPYWLIDLKVLYNLKSVQVFAELENLFDVDIIDIANVPQRGRWMRAGLKYKLFFNP